MKKYVGMMAALAAISGQFPAFRSNDLTPEKIDTTQPKKVIPKGCKEYVFKEEFGTLSVIASNEKQALKKYHKWCNQNKSSNP